MSVLKLAIALLLVTNAWGQVSPIKAPPAAPISCTSEVPALTCTQAKGAFFASQKTSKAMLPVEVVLADKKAFRQENDSLKIKLNRTIAADSASRSNPDFPSPFEHSILFALGESGFVAKVVICVDLFNKVDVDQLEKSKGRAPDPVYFDRESAMTWATYVMGYVDGWHWSRTHTMAEAAETTHQK